MSLSISDVNRTMLRHRIEQLRYENKLLKARLMKQGNEGDNGGDDTDDGITGPVKDDVVINDNQFNEKDSLWTYNISNGMAYVSYKGTATAVDIGADKQPYSKLIDATGRTYMVTSFARLFYNNETITSITLTDWTAKNVDDLSFMFSNCPKLTSITLNGFSTPNATYLRDMFSNCPKLTSITLNGFSVKQARNISYMFAGDYKLTTLDVSDLDGDYITDTSYMFSGCSNLSKLVLGNTHIPAGGEDRTTTGLAPTNNCTITLNEASYNALSSLEFRSNYSMTKWSDASTVDNTLRSVIVKDLEYIASGVEFEGNVWSKEPTIWKYILDGDEVSVVLAQNKSDTVNLTSTDMPYEKLITKDGRAYPVTSYAGMFYNGAKFDKDTQLTISGWTNRNVTDMHNMFQGCSLIKSLTLTNFNTNMVENMGGMFYGCSGISGELSLDSFNTERVTSMISMFEGCSAINAIDIGSFNTQSVKEMSSMFYGCVEVQSITVSDSFTTKYVTTMSNMFYNCGQLVGINLNGFDTSSVRYMSSMFYGCSNLASLDLSAFNTTSVVALTSMLDGCTRLASIKLYKKASKILTVFPGGATTWYVDGTQLKDTNWDDTNWGDKQITFTRTIGT